MRDTAIVAFAETKIVETSQVDIWELGAEVMETLLLRTGIGELSTRQRQIFLLEDPELQAFFPEG